MGSEETWCRRKVVLAGLGLLTSGVSIGVAGANFMNMRGMRVETRHQTAINEEQLELTRQMLEALERIAGEKSRNARSDVEKRAAARAQAEVERLKQKLREAEDRRQSQTGLLDELDRLFRP